MIASSSPELTFFYFQKKIDCSVSLLSSPSQEFECRKPREIVTLDTYRLHLAFGSSPFTRLEPVKFDVFILTI